jgi:hypothetical protein
VPICAETAELAPNRDAHETMKPNWRKALSFRHRRFGRAELVDAAAPGLTWLWQGLLAHQKVTALISQSKSGKTTLRSPLFARTPRPRRPSRYRSPRMLDFRQWFFVILAWFTLCPSEWP